MPEYTVRYQHLRTVRSQVDPKKAAGSLDRYSLHEIRSNGWDVFPLGGETIAEICQDDEVVATGRAVCSDKDHYNKKIGRQIALGRAFKPQRAFKVKEEK